ncbi:hypothetical protein D4R71_00445 [bacterium]|nr:MAG: hypothetical protein D4R71_00445 [bacterium]
MNSNPYIETFGHAAQYKAQKLLRLGKIYKVTEGEYAVQPVLGYNKTTYAVKEIMGKLTCTCQKHHHCSHILAVFLFREQTESITGDRQLLFV